MNNKPKKNNLKRVISLLFKTHPVLVTISIICILIAAISSALPAIFQQRVLEIIGNWYKSGDWTSASKEIIPLIIKLGCLYVLGLIAITAYTQLLAKVTQSYLNEIRKKMFNKMQDLPIKYFDTHKHGDIMSVYTNDTDTLRELVSQSLPAILQSIVLIIAVFCIMIYYSIWLTLVVMFGVIFMLIVSNTVGKRASKYFISQQKSIGKTEAFIQEMMNGQKVIKVFNHEEQCKNDFDKVNNELFDTNFKAHAFANMLGPIIANIGNVLYVLISFVGGVIILSQINNLSFENIISGTTTLLTIDILIPFLNMTKQFTGNVNQVAQQYNSIALALAGADRIFTLIDEPVEIDEGYVKLVNAIIKEDGTIIETEKKTGYWAWKHPHHDGTTTYTALQGDVRMFDVDFAYEEGKTILHDITLYAEPGQKVAFVGATGAGKTTITNLINRFYDIEDGKIRYDGININKIHKSDLRRSLGIVLQDTNLFTGTVYENIRYGKLDATDEECIAAAKLAGADDFITRLPNGYDTVLTNNGDNLSQGQRQLLAIARAAVADPPVMILDEATSSIDTRTEQIVQKGMDKLMEGRTVFVIAHRLSTVKNSDVIMVLDHGHIIERGSHEQLIEQKGQYYQLYTGAFELE